MTDDTSKCEYPQDFYTSLEDAKAEIARRWNDNELRAKVDKVLGSMITEGQLGLEPRAFLCRNIMTPDLEFQHFLNLSNSLGFRPCLLEYIQDKFVARNDDKYYMANLHFYNPDGKKGQEVSHVRIIDFNKWEGHKFCDIQTLNGDKLIEFHHKLLNKFYPEQIENIVDFSDWFNNTRFSTEYYYLYFLSLFIYNGVLFENFLTEDKEELEFTLNKVIPSFNKLKEMYGVKPLIVPLEPLNGEDDRYWWCSPQINKKIIEDMLK